MPSTPSHPPQRIVSLETLPVDVARQLTLRLPLAALETLLRTSTAVARLFRCNDLSFAIAHVRRHFPEPPAHYCTIHLCFCDDGPQRAALSGPDYTFLPGAYAIAAFSCLGVKKHTYPVVFGDTDAFHFAPQVGPRRDPRWIESVLLALVRRRLLGERRTHAIELLFDLAAALDSSELAAAVLEWLTESPSASPWPGLPHPDVDAPVTQLLVAQCAAAAAKVGALRVLAFALDHGAEIDPWDLPDLPRFHPTKPVYAFTLDKTLLLHAWAPTATRLLLGLPLPVVPLARAEAVALPPAGPLRQRLLETGSGLGAPTTALQRAVQLGEVVVFDLLVDAGADYIGRGPAPVGFTPLMLAARTGNHVIVSRLLKMEGVDASDPPGVLAAAVEQGSVEMLRELLKFGAKPDTSGKLPLGFAHRFLAANRRFTHPKTALNTAIIHHKPEVLELFLKHGGDPNAADHHRGPPLHLAASTGDPSVALPLCRLLLSYGANVRLRSPSDRLRSPRDETALHVVEDAETARWLLEHGSEVDARDVEGRMPLHSVCERGWKGNERCVGVVKVLLEAGAEVNAVTGKGRTCLDHLPEESRADRGLREMLVSYGAKHGSEMGGQ
ncbi:hypothetical protein HDU96_004906 [Phlyctochytrium bullatum]|nr:hypothetical protein HDU96_004906 [Phlyctochytrium bullatum]